LWEPNRAKHTTNSHKVSNKTTVKNTENTGLHTAADSGRQLTHYVTDCTTDYYNALSTQYVSENGNQHSGKNTTINTTWNSNKDGTHYSDNDTGEYYHYDGAVYSIHYYSELTSRNSGVESTKNTVDHPTYNFSNLALAKTTYNSKD
jgi:hypothetical protein